MSPFTDQDVVPYLTGDIHAPVGLENINVHVEFIPSVLDDLWQQTAICTQSDDCRAEADGHEPDCPVEQRLKDEIGY